MENEELQKVTDMFKAVLQASRDISCLGDAFVFSEVVCNFEWSCADSKRYLLKCVFLSQITGKHLDYELKFDKGAAEYPQLMEERVEIFMEKLLTFKELFGKKEL